CHPLGITYPVPPVPPCGSHFPASFKAGLHMNTGTPAWISSRANLIASLGWGWVFAAILVATPAWLSFSCLPPLLPVAGVFTLMGNINITPTQRRGVSDGACGFAYVLGI